MSEHCKGTQKMIQDSPSGICNRVGEIGQLDMKMNNVRQIVVSIQSVEQIIGTNEVSPVAFMAGVRLKLVLKEIRENSNR